jgi:hypothetical protein
MIQAPGKHHIIPMFKFPLSIQQIEKKTYREVCIANEHNITTTTQASKTFHIHVMLLFLIISYSHFHISFVVTNAQYTLKTSINKQ